MICYLDTNVVVWLGQGDLSRITTMARQHMESAELLISPIVLLELEYLYEVKRILLPSRDLHLKLEREIGIRVCDLDFPSIVNIALNEKWTRDPFDRIIVSQAKVKGLAHLVSADEEIRQWYPRAVW